MSGKTITGGNWYRWGTSLITDMRNHLPPGPYHRPMPGILRGSRRGGRFLMGEVPLYQGPNKLTGVLLESKCFWGPGIRMQGLGIGNKKLGLRVAGVEFRI